MTLFQSVAISKLMSHTSIVIAKKYCSVTRGSTKMFCSLNANGRACLPSCPFVSVYEWVGEQVLWVPHLM